MGKRFKKSFGGKGFRLNVSKSGIGWSMGGKGFRYTKKANGGTRTTTSIPGTGISYVKDSKTSKKRKSTINSSQINENYVSKNYKLLWILFRICSILMILLGALIALINLPIGIGSMCIGIFEYFIANHYKNKHKSQMLEQKGE